MPSLRARLLAALLRRTLKRRLAADSPLNTQRAAMLRWARLGQLPRGTQIEAVTLGARPAEVVLSRNSAPESPPVLLLHGGGYCWGGLQTHRELASRIALQTRFPVYTLDYRLAPESPYPAAIDDAVAASRELTGRSGGERWRLVGDSAGGGLALATMLRLRDAGAPLPARVALISPWTDLTQSGESIRSLATADPLISPDTLEACSRLYANGTSRESPELSPLFADLTGLPPLLIQVASEEVLLDDSQRLAERCRAQGVNAQLEIEPGLWHVWHLFATAVPEARAAIARLARFLESEAESDLSDQSLHRQSLH